MFRYNCRILKSAKILDCVINRILELKLQKPKEDYFVIALDGKDGLDGQNLDDVEGVLRKLAQDGAIECPYLEAVKLKGVYQFAITLTEEFDSWYAEYKKHKHIQKSTNVKRPTSLIDIPPDTKWENIAIKFLNGHDVKITIKGKAFETNFIEMGFLDSKTKKPNKQWILLRTLAAVKGKKTWKGLPSNRAPSGNQMEDMVNQEFSNNPSAGVRVGKMPDKIRKTKQVLSESLKSYFGIDSDPFLPWKEEQAYNIRINLIL